MTHIPFDFCDRCECKFPLEELEEVMEDSEMFYYCRVCADARPDSWRRAKARKDDYDRLTKSGDDQ